MYVQAFVPPKKEQDQSCLDTLTLWTIFKKICVVSHLPLGSCGPSDDHSIVHPFVILMARLDLDVQMEPVLAGIYRSALHQCL
jgi:hypothetical protein